VVLVPNPGRHPVATRLGQDQLSRRDATRSAARLSGAARRRWRSGPEESERDAPRPRAASYQKGIETPFLEADDGIAQDCPGRIGYVRRHHSSGESPCKMVDIGPRV
jgi:hypothetical protein